MKIKTILGLTLATGMLIASPTTTIAGEAVSKTNFKVDGFYGNVDSEESYGANASVSFPVGKQFGVQIDGMAGEIDSDDIHGVALHAFWRDSEIALVGFTASNTELDTTENNRFGVEAEYYFSNFTVHGTGGHQSGDVKDSVYGGLELKYYPLEDLMISAGAVSTDSNQIYAANIEYQTPLNGFTTFCNVATGNEDYDHFYAGIRYYFGGGEKTLIKHHREDDPSNSLLSTISETLIANKETQQSSTSSEQGDTTIIIGF